MEKKPFVFGVVTSGDHFTDREKETKRLISNFKNGVNTVLISPRRWGKTSLVKKVIGFAASNKLKIVYIDIFSCRSDVDFYDYFASEVLKQTSSKWEEWVNNAKTFLSRINPKFSLGVDPVNDFSISLDINSKNDSIDDVLQLPEKIAQKKGINIVVCIDEFQQIADFGDSQTFQKRLRTIWQQQKAVSYCLFGSKKHLMNELFEKKSLPFYKFGDALYLKKIPASYWIEYICNRFHATGKNISKELAERICRAVDNHSSYVQQLAWLVWIHTEKLATISEFEEAYQDIIDQNTPLFEKETQNLSSYQMNFLRAVVEGVHSQFSTQQVMSKYNLGTSSNVSIIKKALIKKEIIDVDGGEVNIADPVMGLWMKDHLFTP